MDAAGRCQAGDSASVNCKIEGRKHFCYIMDTETQGERVIMHLLQARKCTDAKSIGAAAM